MSNMLFRIESEYSDLADEIVAKLPEELFKSDITTFLDPAFAGGQMLLAVAKRLRKFNHSKENILARLYGWEDNEFYLNHFGVKCGPLAGAKLEIRKYSDIIDIEDLNVNFNVILSNPPFKGEGKNAMYQEFYNKALEISDHIAFVTPKTMIDGFVKGNVDNVKINTKYNPYFISFNKVEKHFDESISFCYFLISKDNVPEESIVEMPYGMQKLNPKQYLISNFDTKEKLELINYMGEGFTPSTGDAGKKIEAGNKVIIIDKIKDGKFVNKFDAKIPNKRFNKDPYKPKVIFNLQSAGRIDEAYLDIKGNVLPSAKHLMAYVTFDSVNDAKRAFKSLDSDIFKKFVKNFGSQYTISHYFSMVKVDVILG